MRFDKVVGLFLVVVFLTGCVTRPPSKTQDLCAIFTEKKSWYKAAKKSEKKWGSPVPVMMSIMYQESQYKHDAKPARRKILWVIPGSRPSNAYGYPQALNSTWKEYQREAGGAWARRDNFEDAIDFIGWYNNQGQIRSGIRLADGYSLYLAYHEGHGGFNRGSYKGKGWLMRTAQNVSTRAQTYDQQLRGCESRLDRGWWVF